MKNFSKYLLCFREDKKLFRFVTARGRENDRIIIFGFNGIINKNFPFELERGIPVFFYFYYYYLIEIILLLGVVVNYDCKIVKYSKNKNNSWMKHSRVEPNGGVSMFFKVELLFSFFN